MFESINTDTIDIKEILDLKKDAKVVMMSGHVRPDGDCVGACVAVKKYIEKVRPDLEVYAYLSVVPKVFSYMNAEDVITTTLPDKKADIFFALDLSSPDRMGDARAYFDDADLKVVMDHHVSNEGFGDVNVIDPHGSSACELLYHHMEKDYIDKKIAEALYTGIVTDTGGFCFPDTKKSTMIVAGELMEIGINFQEIIDSNLNNRTYTQSQLLGRALTESMFTFDRKCIFTTITMDMMNLYEAETEDIEGIVEELRATIGVEVAILLHQIGFKEYKVSLRSKDYVDVSKIAVFFGGGGHLRAAGVEMYGSHRDVLNNLLTELESQI
ncbi:MAG: bifunctional oligoribonuclease/PAP phosphatase NrnA [Lachnospiraceae bacterium]|nr:bifunctional oligoribonuclease/PAP phosphatase NrnA [Lachnospiraceae bacterium]